MKIQLKRIYEQAADGDGYRVLVDRLWPRGVAKATAHLDRWDKDVAPSPELRRAWHADTEGHSPEHFAAFAASYRAELRTGVAREALDALIAIAHQHPSLTLLYGAKDTRINHAVVLREALLERAAESASQ